MTQPTGLYQLPIASAFVYNDQAGDANNLYCGALYDADRDTVTVYNATTPTGVQSAIDAFRGAEPLQDDVSADDLPKFQGYVRPGGYNVFPIPEEPNRPLPAGPVAYYLCWYRGYLFPVWSIWNPGMPSIPYAIPRGMQIKPEAAAQAAAQYTKPPASPPLPAIPPSPWDPMNNNPPGW